MRDLVGFPSGNCRAPRQVQVGSPACETPGGLRVPPASAGRAQGLKGGASREPGPQRETRAPPGGGGGRAKMAGAGPRPSAPAPGPSPQPARGRVPRLVEEPLPSPQGTPASPRRDCSVRSRALASSARLVARSRSPSRPGSHAPGPGGCGGRT